MAALVRERVGDHLVYYIPRRQHLPTVHAIESIDGVNGRGTGVRDAHGLAIEVRLHGIRVPRFLVKAGKQQ